ncbi:MAG: peptidoglycan DD-metalloendopeptidase family protein [Pseudomonadota bacterium]|nr:peptidoglycan DD-metalloendopeptidase family protein [Pseudomonadota bacterium]
MSRLLLILLMFSVMSANAKSHLPPVEDRSLPLPAYKHQYYIHKGDTIYSVAFANDIDYRYLAEINGLKPPYALHPGDKLRVRKPPFKKIIALKSTSKEPKLIQDSKQSLQVEEAQPMRFSGGFKMVENHPKTNEKDDESPQQQKNKLKIEEKDLNEEENYVQYWTWPIRGKVVNHFSPGQLGNKGIDIAGQLGQPVQAAASGSVVYSGSGLRGYGNLIIIKHNSRFLSAYAYNYKLKVKEGDEVKEGQEIATVGRATSGELMLHFEIRLDGQPVNPTRYLR